MYTRFHYENILKSPHVYYAIYETRRGGCMSRSVTHLFFISKTLEIFLLLCFRYILPLQAVDLWRLHRDSALLACGTCLQGLESISLEVGNQQGRHHDVSPKRGVPECLSLDDASLGQCVRCRVGHVYRDWSPYPWRLVINNKDAITMFPRSKCPPGRLSLYDTSLR